MTNLNNCFTCNKETSNPKFCSLSCSAIERNKNMIRKRRKTKICKRCPTLIVKKRTFCEVCSPLVKDWNIITLGETSRKRGTNRNTHIRDLARNKFLRTGYPRKCLNCGYSKHFQICHIKPMSSFSEDIIIGVINDFSNIIPLCPNCHWEFDHLDLIIPQEILDKYIQDIQKLAP